ncbi:FAD dependent oxidoreductase [Kalmanozyma brasiliensis GHG001]|uniref:FAD dependent oxidoreductase domain-containing protein n=1 Tax=Kalmanozyma brasiliensis (strain GHG001) TaxID=1365824 RepID=V5E4E4_KALBG|nr:FAD dependent oxidoreductase [Kalmanozyma brasiliensis GHG001]EST05031.1 FAD dependent oxidoreductase [Kalmanozyma brasiliensis GHG001]
MPLNEQEYVDISTIGIDNVAHTPSPLPSSSDKATVSYWMASTSEDQLPSSLETLPSHSDVVIIGAGITGVSTALHLVEAAPSSISSITLIEARGFCTGATGRNGGHLTAVSALAYTDLAANPNHLLGKVASSLTDDEVKTSTAAVVEQILQFESDTAAAIRALIVAEQADKVVGFTDESNWHLCFSHAEVEAFEHSLGQAGEHAGLGRFVNQVRRVPTDEVDRRMNRPAGVVAVYEIPGATLHPRLLVIVMFKRAQRLAREKGIALNLVTHLPVLQTRASVTGTILSTAKGEIEARYVVHATNGYASHLLPELSGTIIPTRAQVVAVPPKSGARWGMGLSAGGGYEYGHARPASKSGLYIFGGGREHATGREWGVADDSKLNHEVSDFLHPWLAKTFPTSYGEDVEREWTGIMGYTKSKDPLVGPVDGRRGKEYLAAGYSGHGMTRAWGCAKVVAEMIGADAEGRGWRKGGGFPDCCLTMAGRAMSPEKVDREATPVEAEMRVEKAHSTSAYAALEEKGMQGEIDRKSGTSGKHASCCTVT